MDYLLYNLAEHTATEADTQLLDAYECEQYAARGETYLIARALLKKELSRRSGVPAGDIHFCYNEHGKPTWPQQHFNMSHSARLLCLAFHHAEIGVDIQQIRTVRRMDDIALRIMSSQQLEQFRAHGSSPEEFFTCWSIAEALVKLHGATIWDACNYPYTYAHGRVSLPAEYADIGVHLFTPAPGFCGAVAMRH